MAGLKESIVVAQHDNHKHHADGPKDDNANPEYIYIVQKCVNTLRVRIGEKLTPYSIRELIKMEVSVTIQGNK